MTAFVVLAAGRGSRLGRTGEHLHKCLVPLDGKAAITWQLERRPYDSRVIVCVGDRAWQVRAYLQLAHPELPVTYVMIEDWDQPGGGPGSSLLQARGAVGDEDLVFTSCDTLWWDDPHKTGPLSDGTVDYSWMAVAPVPAGTPEVRWCRVVYDPEMRVTEILDKVPDHRLTRLQGAYVGLGRVRSEDLDVFWSGIEDADLVSTERQVSGGFQALLQADRTVAAVHTLWTDIGDETSYRAAVAQLSGYDWTKTNQATYVLPDDHRVVKYHADDEVAARRWARGVRLADASVVPEVRPALASMFAIEYVPGVSYYDYIEANHDTGATKVLLDWVDEHLRAPFDVPLATARRLATDFYLTKTLDRILQLPQHLRSIATDVVSRIDWDALVSGVQPSATWHGDLNYGNIIVDHRTRIWGIDWREDFAGQIDWGDARYDVAKLLAGTFVHWDNARRGDFRPWPQGEFHAAVIRSSRLYTYECEVIGALSLLNSAPLHASPLDEVLVARACAWLTEVL